MSISSVANPDFTADFSAASTSTSSSASTPFGFKNPSYLESFAPIATSAKVQRVQPRSYLQSSAAVQDLGGSWSFNYATDTRGAGPLATVASTEFDASNWDEIKVPGHWVLQGGGEFGAFGKYGAPAYQNIMFPFPVDPPHAPQFDNPTGDYRREFELDQATAQTLASGGRIYLRTLGIESLAVLFINGEFGAVITGSRLMQELDVTDLLQPGKNLIHFRVHQFSAHSYLEDQDQWWLPGIFREVQLVIRPQHGIEDVWLQADYVSSEVSQRQGQGAVVPQIRATAEAFPIKLEIPELNFEQVFASAADLRRLPVGLVTPWSADLPKLYTAKVSNAVETIELKLGFRRVEIQGNVWMVNGKKLRLAGVNRHEYDPDLGRTWNYEKARAGLLLMKQHNINAIRTAHYPPHPEFFDLADELGFWVIDECDYEAHGFEYVGWKDVPADDPRWRAALLDRVERFFERDKNHASIICWSLGNEGHTGMNMAAMSAYIHRRDTERPVHYEPDFAGEYTDIVSRMYAPLEEMERMANGFGDSRTDQPGRAAALARRPMILCEYAHAMGNGPGGLWDYEERFDALYPFHGGFIWEWRDHGIRTVKEGKEFFAYGGDFGEQLHDGSFVCDGLVLSDGTPTPALAEVKAAFSRVRIHLWCDGGFGETLTPGKVHADGTHYLTITDERHCPDPEGLRIVLIDSVDGVEVNRQYLHVTWDLPEIANDFPIARFELPAWDTSAFIGSECFRTISVETAFDTSWAKAGHEIIFQQVKVVHPVAASKAQLLSTSISSTPATTEEKVEAGEPSATLESFAQAGIFFDELTGDLKSFKGLDLQGPRLSLWRSPTENDSLSGFGSYVTGEPAETGGFGSEGPSNAEMWESMHLPRLQRSVLGVEFSKHEILILHRYSAPTRNMFVDLELRWCLVDSGDLQLQAQLSPSTGWRYPWARIALVFQAPVGAGEAFWFGSGPNENYPDTFNGSRIGRFSMPVENLVTNYAVPQESGHRAGLRALSLSGLGLTVKAEPTLSQGGMARYPGFSVREHDEWQVAAAKHPHELPEPSHTFIYFEAAQHGIGSRSCGPDVRPEHHLWAQAAAWDLRFQRD